MLVACAQEALNEICNILGDTPSATEIRALWNEYEAGSTEEAKIVKVYACHIRFRASNGACRSRFVCRLVQLAVGCRILTNSR